MNSLKKTKRHKGLRMEDRLKVYDLVRKYCFLPIEELKRISENRLVNGIDALIVSVLARGIQKGDVNVLKYILGVFGVVEFKAIAITEIDNLSKSLDEDQNEINLTKAEKLEMIEKYKQLVDNE